MSDDAHGNTCDGYSDNLAELALGILTGRERVATLAHVEACTRCAEELEQLARAADDVVLVAPQIEPPVGFETRLFERMGVTAPAEVVPLPRRLAAPHRWALAAAAAVVALAVGLGIGWSTGSNRPGPTPSATAPHPAGTPMAEAALVEGGRSVGRVSAYGGSTPWLFMTLADSSAHGRVTCVVVTTAGVTERVGTFMARAGYGAWGAPLRVPPKDVKKAEVVSSDGSVIATATMT
jgi:hypothetical protein